jgi:cytochrome P450 family 103
MDRDPHGVFRRYRPVTPLTRRDDGSYIVIRANDVERIRSADAADRDGVRGNRGITNGPVFNLFRDSMLLSNGVVHRKRWAYVATPAKSLRPETAC